MKATHSPGERITELCRTYSITRETLAERSGLDIELIRRIEEDGHIPDLAPLVRLSRALGVRLGTLLDDREELGPVITRAGEAGKTPRFVTGVPPESRPDSPQPPAGQGPSPDTGGPEAGRPRQGLSFSALAADKGGRHMEPFIVDIEGDAEQTKSTHEGEEFIHVLSGRLSLEYGTDNYTLETGDSVYYDSIVPHRVLSADASPLKILAVIYTPV
ncbi:MAG: XRE family transcriptional regulator [Treponema sp.]|jgi:transcriptional regulator with XRE-family HTH domain/quercetin dioxygenase-like cupin family protein|nr:XRE family transcriptional regulator [Treponema sp.]